ncbi:MAG: virulence factor [Alphaproteobacteria bacterium]
MADMIIVWWKDIPAQVIVKKSRREQFKYVLEERFEKAIDRAAMRGREVDTDAYLAGFVKSEPVAVEDGDLQAIATAKGKELEAEYTDEVLEPIIKNSGVKE